MNSKIVSITAISFILIIIVSGAFLAIGFPDQTSECDVCHTNTSVLILTSNATGTVEAVNGVPFVISINGSNGVEALKIVSDWADNSKFSFSLMQISDGDPDDSDADTGEISVDISVTPLETGSFTIRIWVAAPGQLSASLDVSVDVSENTSSTTPTTSTTTSATPTQDPVETWTSLMLTINPIVAVVLIVLGFVLFKRVER